MSKFITATGTIAALAVSGPLHAHHSISMFDLSDPLWVEGTVIRYEPIAPHAMFLLETRGADGQTQQWTIEGPFPGRLNRILEENGIAAGAAFLEPGDVVAVCGFDLREDLRANRPTQEPGGTRFMHGHVLVMPDGHMQSWGPYGKTDNCIRPNDRTQAWRDFLNADPLARDLWCNSRVYVKTTTARPQAFVDAVDGLIDRPCD
jgi:Family of unknown function (DUF6152)